MLYAVSVYERWENGNWEFVECVKIFREQKHAIEFAYRNIEKSFYASRYYMVGIISEELVRAGGFEDLIES